MSLTLVSLRDGRLPSTGITSPAADGRRLREYDLLGEEAFLPMLSQERKRSERSGKPFLLLLLRSDGYREENGPRAVEQVVSAIEASTREIDVLGWYTKGEVLGVIFTEIEANNRAAIEAVLTRVTAALSQSVDPQDLDKISITCHVYPEQLGKPQQPSNVKVFYPDASPGRGSRSVSYVVKRSVDVMSSLAAMMVLLPFFLVIALLIKLTSKGPVFFRQKRIGRYGEEFTFLKFRSMFVNNDSQAHKDYVQKFISGTAKLQPSNGNGHSQNGVFKITNDPRVTPVGRFLRRTSLDEIPQFLNVLRGDMSLVGPRPPLPYEFECYSPWHRKRVFEVKPGITGLWQVNGRSRTSFDDMVRLDLKYAQTWSLWLDLKILARTPKAVFSGDGAY
jgi:exopolysaccharide biosynthesis polyprenyl glycosylphosphotransferase